MRGVPALARLERLEPSMWPGSARDRTSRPLKLEYEHHGKAIHGDRTANWNKGCLRPGELLPGAAIKTSCHLDDESGLTTIDQLKAGGQRGVQVVGERVIVGSHVGTSLVVDEPGVPSDESDGRMDGGGDHPTTAFHHASELFIGSVQVGHVLE